MYSTNSACSLSRDAWATTERPKPCRAGHRFGYYAVSLSIISVESTVPVATYIKFDLCVGAVFYNLGRNFGSVRHRFSLITWLDRG